MDLRAYYKKVRETEAAMPAPQVVMVSLATPDGGKAGVATEVPTPIAARMVVEGSAREATDAEAGFHERHAAARQAAEQAAQAGRVQVVVVPSSTATTKFPGRSGKEQ